MAQRDTDDTVDSIFRARDAAPDVGAELCRLVGRLSAQGDGLVRFYPTCDTGVWLEISSGDIVERIEHADPAKPSTIVVQEQARMSLRMDVTASAVRSLLAAAASDRARPDWRSAPRVRAQASARRTIGMRKAPPSLS